MATPQLQNKTVEYFYKLCKMGFLCGLPNFWVEDLFISHNFTKLYRTFSRIVAVLVYVFLAFEISACFVNKDNLTEKQQLDLLLYGISHPMLWYYTVVLTNQAAKMQNILSDIIQLTKVLNDPEVERRMVMKSKIYSSVFVSSCVGTMILYNIDACLRVITSGETFTTIVTVYPGVENNSAIANLVRVLWNFLWWALVIRALAVYAFVFSLTTNLSHQFVNLQIYFYSLDDKFKEESMNQREIKYEEAFKVGVKFFANSMHCVDQSKVICGKVFSGQIVFNLTLLVIYLFQLLASDTLASAVAIAISATACLLGTGVFMCNAGDVSYEASRLATAMYCSGWHHCQSGQSSRCARLRRLVVISMMAAQQPVVIKGLGIMVLSYESYVSLVKASYSLFSVLY